MTELDAKVRLVEFRPDQEWQHVAIVEESRCQTCQYKPCLAVCPSAVFRSGNRPNSPVEVHYRQCVECGACRLACGDNNIIFAYPRTGHGVVFHQG